MKLLSIQVGLPKAVDYRGRQVETGIFKDPISGPAMIRFLNIEGDGQADLTVHGGADKAVYAYSFAAYDWWKKQRPQDSFSFGAFGENLTFDELLEDKIFIGDTFSLGGAILQAAQPRFPCYKLGVKFNDPKIIRTFMDSERPGVYFRVIQEGLIKAGDELQLLDQEKDKHSILRLFSILQGDDGRAEEIRSLANLKSLPKSIRDHLL